MSSKRHEIVRLNREKIEHLFADAIKAGESCPVIVILDLSDELGRKIAEVVAGKERCSTVINSRLDNSDPLLLIYSSYDVAVGFPGSSKLIVDKFLTDGLTPIFTFSDGGHTWTGMPKPS